ncbi:KAP family P-loop NTPase fold protein [Methanococcus maripaludis]|uniref:KAP NTPase domain-containing protein n=1 Tax=Methanococcus maripaludis TaxID=39152 RepID=A0A7J9RZD2_METMI|nr:P-loop NTPase fold protein [Methanococcus maripaludis]MBB6067555.1 hypothetical protein [Methanococcus maripaludis]
MVDYNISMSIANPEGKDLLERRGFHQSVSEIMKWQDPEKNGFIIGLYGSWGSGKSFSIDKSIKLLESSNISELNRPLIVHFNPWYFTETDDLILNFFGALTGALKSRQSFLKNLGGNIGDELLESVNDLASSLDGYFEKMISLALPVMEPNVLGAGLIGKKITRKIQKKYEESYSIVNLKEKLNKKFGNLPFRTLVIMDDIDRLNDKEICQILHLVKCLADFKNITYLLSFDEKIVSNALECHQHGYGMHYLEKIIQFPIKMPEPHAIDLENILEKELENIIGENPRDIPQYFKFYPLCFSNMIKNIRDVNRYIAIFNFNWNLLKNQVNKIDLIVLTAIQVFTPEIYDWIKNNKELFVGYSVFDGAFVHGGSEYDHTYYKNKINGYLKNYRSIDSDEVYYLLTAIFPNSSINQFRTPDTYNGDSKNRIYGENSFNNYFMYCKSKHEFQAYELDLYKKQGLIEEDFEGFLYKLSKSDRLDRYILKLCGNGESLYQVPPENRTIIANGLIYSLEHVKSYSKNHIAENIVIGLHKLFSPTREDPKLNTEIIINSLKKSSESYLVIDEIIRRSKNKDDRLTDVYSADELIYLDFEYLENNKLVEIINELYKFDSVKHFETIEAILSGINKEQTLSVLKKLDKTIFMDCIANVKEISGVNIGANLVKLLQNTTIDSKILDDISNYLKYLRPYIDYNTFKNSKFPDLLGEIRHDFIPSNYGGNIQDILQKANGLEICLLITFLNDSEIIYISEHVDINSSGALSKINKALKLKPFIELENIDVKKIKTFLDMLKD